MSKNNKYRHGGRGAGGRHVQLPEWVQTSEAWATMKPGPRALYIELKRLFNGSNNGAIFLSHRNAAEAINVGRDTAGTYYEELVGRGFIIVTRGHCLGPEGVGQSATYALTEIGLNGVAATREFMKWKKQKPRRKTQHSLAGKSDTPCRKIQCLPIQMSENPTALAQIRPPTVWENPAIYTYDHMQGVRNHSLGRGLCGKATMVFSQAKSPSVFDTNTA